MFWLGSLGPMLDTLAEQIRCEHDRQPDPGDLLIVVLSQRDTIAGELAAELGIDLDQLAERLDTLRQQHVSPHDAVEDVRREKEVAKENGDRALADQLR